MSATIDKPTAAPSEPLAPAPAPEAPVAEAPARLCATCAAPLAAGQDWCLECGSAQPGRLGGRPGWRAALSVMGATAVLALGAGAAAYAALNSDANRQAASAPPAAAAPVVSAPPAQTAPAPPAPATPEVPAPASEPADVPAPSSSSDDSSANAGGDTSSSSPSAPETSGSTDAGGDAGVQEQKKVPDTPTAIALDAGAASTYDPYNRGGDLVGDPADAIDGKASTAWEAPVDADGKVGVGLALSLDARHLIKQLRFDADTPGFRVEIYGSDAKRLPPDVLDARWTHVRDLSDVGVTEKVKIGHRPFRHVLLWITDQPADEKVAIPEVELLK